MREEAPGVGQVFGVGRGMKLLGRKAESEAPACGEASGLSVGLEQAWSTDMHSPSSQGLTAPKHSTPPPSLTPNPLPTPSRGPAPPAQAWMAYARHPLGPVSQPTSLLARCHDCKTNPC